MPGSYGGDGFRQHGHLSADDGGTLAADAIPALAAVGKVVLSSGNVTTTSSPLTDLSGASLSVTTRNRRVLLLVSLSASNDNASAEVFFNFSVDGANEPGSTIGFDMNVSQVSHLRIVTGHHVTAVLAAGAHTFKVRWGVNAGTGTVYGSASVPLEFTAMEIP